jgi:rare lipoprotein A
VRHICIVAIVAAVIVLSGPAEAKVGARCGKASWYAMTSRTASGERASPNTFSAAHRSLPFGTRVRVRNLANGRTVTVRINDRGPFVRGRIIDLSRAAAARLGILRRGTARVCLG